jgi:hypothetical protein
MKAIYLKSLFAAALAVTLSSCEKKAENFEKLSEKSTASISEVVYPLNGNEMPVGILPKAENLPKTILIKDYENYPNVKAKVFDQVCEEYLKGTKKMDLSKLKDCDFLGKFGNEEFSIVTTQRIKKQGVRKLDNGPNGWWAHWNYSPYTESEYPTVLFAVMFGSASNSLDFTFSKKVSTFGFEVAPNTIGGTFKVTVRYQEESWYHQPEIINLVQTVSSPSGARLIALKSDIPFQRVTIDLESTLHSEGVAIANIRYKLAK